MNVLETIKEIRAELFRLAKQSPSLETMHWYISLDDCFENDEFDPGNHGNAIWRCRVLYWGKQPVEDIARKIDELIQCAGYKVINPKDILKTAVVKSYMDRLHKGDKSNG